MSLEFNLGANRGRGPPTPFQPTDRPTDRPLSSPVEPISFNSFRFDRIYCFFPLLFQRFLRSCTLKGECLERESGETGGWDDFAGIWRSRINVAFSWSLLYLKNSICCYLRGEERRFEKLRRNRGWKFFFGLKKERKREEVRVTRNNGVGRGGNKWWLDGGHKSR